MMGSDVLFYECGHAVAQRDITGAFQISVFGNEDIVPGLCPNCQEGRTQPHDDKTMTKNDLLVRFGIHGLQ